MGCPQSNCLVTIASHYEYPDIPLPNRKQRNSGSSETLHLSPWTTCTRVVFCYWFNTETRRNGTLR